MSDQEIYCLTEFHTKFPDEEATRLHFENVRWSTSGKFCPHCSSYSVAECKDLKPMPYRCKDCRKHFSVRTGTILEESRLPLLKWLMAIYMMTTCREAIPLTKMAKDLGVTKKSTWIMILRIREAWITQNSADSGGGQLDGEETNERVNKKTKKVSRQSLAT